MTEELIVKQLKQIIHDRFEGNVKLFAQTIEVSPTTVYSSLKRGKNMNVKILMGLKAVIPELDMNTFFGTGRYSPYVMETNQRKYGALPKNNTDNQGSDIDKLIDFLKSNTLKISIEK